VIGEPFGFGAYHEITTVLVEIRDVGAAGVAGM